MDGIVFIRDLAVVMIVAGAVGWLFQRLKVSLVVGYLLAGVMIGPYTPPFALVADLQRVEMLAQIGLVFLIFSVGLGLSFSRLQRLGVSLAAAVAVSSILLFNLCRLFGLGMGWTHTQSLFLAGMVMVSSSAIISKVLQELNATHRRPGQMALGMTVLEDVVAVVMLTVLASVVHVGQAEPGAMWKTMGSLSAFVVFLVLISLLIVPRLLNRLSRESTAEVRVIVVAGLVLISAFVAEQSGYSLALGAFILGVVIAGTPHKEEVERAFEGLRSIFGAVFFVAIGMLLDVSLLREAWLLVVMAGVFVLMARPLACAIGLVAVGNSSRDAVRAGLALVPIGEFSFIMAQLGVDSGLTPKTFYALAVGLSVVTAVCAPVLTRHSEPLSRWIENREPKFLKDWIAFYQRWLGEIHGWRNASVFWRFTSKRLWHATLQVLFVSALILLAAPLYERTEEWLGEDAIRIVFWLVFGLVLLGPLIAIWRNIETLSMILSEGMTQRTARTQSLRPLIQTALKTVAAVVLAFWFLALFPFGLSVLWGFGFVLALLGVSAAVFWRRFIRWHSRIEIELQEQIRSAMSPAGARAVSPSMRRQQQEWNLELEELRVPAASGHAGRSVKELNLRARFGCSIVGIDRSGYLIPNPSPEDRVFPEDKLLMLGTEEQISEVEQLFTRAVAEAHEGFEELTTEAIEVPSESPRAGRALGEMDLIRRFGIQIGGIERNGERTLVPSGDQRIQPGDLLLVVGTHDRIQDFRVWLQQSGAIETDPSI